MNLKLTFLLATAMLSLVARGGLESCAAQDAWPQWRGANWDSVSNATDLPDQLDDDHRLWRTQLPGPGGASPIVWGDRLFVTSVDESDQSLWLICLDVDDGSIRWKRRLEGKNQPTRDQGNSASPSPSTDGKHVWAMMTHGILHCFTVDGTLVWKKDLQAEYGQFDIQFGMTTTPILDRGRLYVQLIHGPMREPGTSQATVIALEAGEGRQIWRYQRETPATRENKHSYASPIIVRTERDAWLVTHGADYAIGHSLDDGRERWRCGGLNPLDSYNPFLRLVSSPCYRNGLLVVPSAKSGPVLGLEVAQFDSHGDITQLKEAHRCRRNRNTPDVATPLIYRGVVYLARENGILIGLDANRGALLFSERMLAGNHRSTPVAGDGKVYLAGRKGKLIVLQAGPEPRVIRSSQLNETVTASPAIAGGRVFIRSFQAVYAFGQTHATAAKADSTRLTKLDDGEKMNYAIAIHGGAGSSPKRFSEQANQQRRKSMEQALTIGTDILKQGGTALDAVEAVVRFLEEDPQFNAGIGAVFNAEGSHELDASIMDGKTLKCGAVAGVMRVKHPITLARRVMSETRHILLAGAGAEQFARQQGFESVEPNYFDTPATRAAWLKKRDSAPGSKKNPPESKSRAPADDRGSKTESDTIRIQDEDTGSYLGTVGCVALDQDGNLAAATSTGGLTNKRFGRVGDSPILGAGNYADNATCAVSGTGIGEQFMRHVAAYQVAARMRFQGQPLHEAVRAVLTEELDPGDGGLIAVDRNGRIAMQFTTDGMARAAADSSGRFEVLWEESPQETPSQ